GIHLLLCTYVHPPKNLTILYPLPACLLFLRWIFTAARGERRSLDKEGALDAPREAAIDSPARSFHHSTSPCPAERAASQRSAWCSYGRRE
ncbi:hypothetical protein B0H10DRAFT_1976529, partial [Mycena sp. CBHHK59/15]